jgi:hypothetical protein
MERRYLVAALAMITAFAATSHGFRALQQMSAAHVRHSGAMAHPMHEPSCAARALAKIRTHLRPRYPEEAQLLAEMNVPLAGLDNMAGQMAGQITQQVTEQVTEQIAQQNIAQCATAQAMRDTDRARRDAIRMQQSMTHAAEQASIGPMAVEMNLPADLDQRINAALADRMAASNVKLQVLADKLRQSSMRIDNLDIPIVDVTDDSGAPAHVHVHVRCNVNNRTQRQQPQ